MSISLLILFRYVSISDEAAGGSQVLFCLEGCGRRSVPVYYFNQSNLEALSTVLGVVFIWVQSLDLGLLVGGLVI